MNSRYCSALNHLTLSNIVIAPESQEFNAIWPKKHHFGKLILFTCVLIRATFVLT
jgi:hypothetical protein